MKYSSRWNNPYNRGMGRKPEIPVNLVLELKPHFDAFAHNQALVQTQQMLRRIGEKK